MKFGIQHGMGDPSWQPEILEPQNVISWAQAVDASGFEFLAFTDHPSPSKKWVDNGGEGIVEMFTALGFCAAVTERVRLLSWMVVVPYHNPFALAHRIASVDFLSNGRFTFGAGLGYLKSEFSAQGVDFDSRREIFDENMSVIRSALSGDEVTHEGKGFSARGIVVEPPTHQKPHPPIWIHGNGDFGTKRAAEYAQGWVGLFTTEQSVRTIRTTALPDIEAFAKRIDTLRIELEKAGRSISDIDVVATAVVPKIDNRIKWNVNEYKDRFGALEDLGVTAIIVNACGDDANVSESATLQFAADFIN